MAQTISHDNKSSLVGVSKSLHNEMIKNILSFFSMKLSHYITNGSINDIEEISHSDSSCDENENENEPMNESVKCGQQEEVIDSKQEQQEVVVNLKEPQEEINHQQDEQEVVTNPQQEQEVIDSPNQQEQQEEVINPQQEEDEINSQQEEEEVVNPQQQEEIKQSQLSNNDNIISLSIIHSLIKPQQCILFTHRERNHLSTVPLTIEDETETEIKKMKTKRIKIQNCEYSIEKTSSHVVTKSHDCISYNLFFGSINSQLSNMILSSSNSCIIYNSILFPYHLQDQLSESELIVDIFTVLLNSSNDQ